MSETPKLYKVLVEGRSPAARITWSLPIRGVPGVWREVQGKLVRCSNGLHLTDDPVGYRKDWVNAQCYLAETEGDILGPFGGHEYVARKVRLVKRVAWSEFKWIDPEPDVDPAPVTPKEKSPAYVLLAHVWKHEGHGMGKSWDRLNWGMRDALKLAIRVGMRFDESDFASFAEEFNSYRWIGDGESLYTLAIGERDRTHGPNASAYQSFEAWSKRKPFLVRLDPNDKTPKRLSVGQEFKWLDGDKLIDVTVTSFNDAKSECVACQYEGRRQGGKLLRRFTINHEKIKEYHAKIAEAAKKKAEAKQESEAA